MKMLMFFCLIAGDIIGIEVQMFNPDLSTVLFIKNSRPIGTRYLSLKDPEQFFPTIALCGNGYDVELHVYYQNRISAAPQFLIVSYHRYLKNRIPNSKL